jgi:hypothetical protein
MVRLLQLQVLLWSEVEAVVQVVKMGVPQEQVELEAAAMAAPALLLVE